jgi:hypothetical protein
MHINEQLFATAFPIGRRNVGSWPVAAYSCDAEAPAALKCTADQQKAQTLADRLYWGCCPDAGETRRRLEIGDVLKVLAPG